MPKHIAIVMDGNRRWSEAKGFYRMKGHQKGVERVKKIIIAANELGIKVLTLYTFSTENWSRPLEEINFLMKLLKSYLKSEVAKLHKNNIVFNVLGEISNFPGDIQKIIKESIKLTKNNTGLILNLALNYGARAEIVRAVNILLKENVKHVTEKDIQNALYTKNLTDPDLFIRTAGEIRISNFLLWQIAYTELVFIQKCWPDFTKKDFIQAIEEYRKRKRRFGK